ncbi:MAG TPA: trimeric intracellular cation channel family protein [Nocardioides sp.]|nr:trimeric intracellular cation channel family protein [Nocardioides sp.]
MLIVDLLATLVFAVSGGLTAVRARMDVVGVMVLAAVTGIGGGLIRDVLIGATPPVTLTDWRYVVVPIVAGLATFLFHPQLGRLERPIKVFDAFGLGLFTVAGALKAADHGVTPIGAIALGVVTGVGGGVLRDILTNQVPLVLRKSELYAIPSAVGAALAVLGHRADQPDGLVLPVSAAVVIGWRLLAIWRGWTSPDVDHTATWRRRA